MTLTDLFMAGKEVNPPTPTFSSSSSSSSCGCEDRIHKLENELRKVTSQCTYQNLCLKHVCSLLDKKYGLDLNNEIMKNIGPLPVDDDDVDLQNGMDKTVLSNPVQSNYTNCSNDIHFPEIVQPIKTSVLPTTTTPILLNNNSSGVGQNPYSGKTKTVVVYKNKRKLADNENRATTTISGNTVQQQLQSPSFKKANTMIIPISTTNFAPGSNITRLPFTLPKDSQYRIASLTDGSNKQIVYYTLNPSTQTLIPVSNENVTSSSPTVSNENSNTTATILSSPILPPTQTETQIDPTPVEMEVGPAVESTTTTTQIPESSPEIPAADIPIKMEVEVDQEITCENTIPDDDDCTTHHEDGQFIADNQSGNGNFVDEAQTEGIYPDYPHDDSDIHMTSEDGKTMIVHETDPNIDIDIKYDPYGELGFNDEQPVENEEYNVPIVGRSLAQEPVTQVATTSNHASSSVVPSPSPYELMVRRLIPNMANSTFDWMWILQMSKYQSKSMPYGMIIKREDIRQYLEYIPNQAQPHLSRYRCWICTKFIKHFKYPEKNWGPMETEGGQLGSSPQQNRNFMNSHLRKKSHSEIIKKLSTSENNPISPIVLIDKLTQKELLDSLKCSE